MGMTLPPYVLMWGLAIALYGLCKWASWLTLPSVRREGQGKQRLIFLLGYPGMDPEQFLSPPETRPSVSEWATGLFKLLAGAGLVWMMARQFYSAHPEVAAWVGMVGLVFVLHFGCFHLLALMWQEAGFGAQPIMRSPLMADSLSDFWSGRWNLAFHFLASRFLYVPIRRRVGTRIALLATFLGSGLIHELVITVPARGGYGLPTLYFMLQGAGILVTRSRIGGGLRLRKGPAARVFTWCVTLLPVCWLFPPVFLRNVILPFLKAIGAL
jgi:hypothetical protein